ncbi:MAG: DNA cytosine methyltransferase, partial [Sulfuritalea sp.]|nr:DNA cytosine methyltransferase [Sulfuritalea sp.]
AWLQALKAIGMRCDWKVLTCADYGDATTRERFFLYGRSDKKALRWPDATHAPRGYEVDLLDTRKTWRSAAEIIDWSRPGTSIFTRKRPLVKNTLSRLLAGAQRNHWPKQHIEALQDLIDGKAPRLQVSAEEAEAISRQLGMPLVMGTASPATARGADRPIPALTAGGGVHFAESILLHKHDSDGGRSFRSVLEPAPTFTTEGAPSLARPIITPYYGGGSGLTGQSADEPMPAQGTRDRFALATPFLVPNFGERPGQEPRTHSIDEPAPTIAASGHIQLAQAVIAPCTHHDSSNRARGADEPLPTITGANRGDLAMAQPFVSLCTHGNDRNAGRAVDEPLATVTTAKGGEMTLATPALAEGYYIDILYRMLHWSELARATSFEDEGRPYQFTGTATEITKQIGNAVPIRTGTALCASALEGLRAAA